ncbi:hypothetical protein [Spiroplasma endosymbiont of Virgichneumon dumeticola]
MFPPQVHVGRSPFFNFKMFHNYHLILFNIQFRYDMFSNNFLNQN